MGQKIHPTGFRLAVTRNWTSKWFANSKHFGPTLKEDIKIREYLKKKLGHASVGKITIERPAKNARITIYSARPGVVIGKKGEDIETLRSDLRRMMGGDVGPVVVLGVGDRRQEHLLDDDGALLRAEGEDVERLVHGQPADLVGDEPALLRRQPHASQDCFGFHDAYLTSSPPAAPRPSCRPSGP